VFPGGPPPPVLTKRQFLALAHVAEVAQSRAFDLMIAEDALRPQAPSASHKKRPPAIRDAHIDTWQIAAAAPPPPVAVAEQQQAQQQQLLQAAHEPYGAAAAAAAAPYAGLLAASALAADAPGPLEAALPQGAGRLSRATSLQLAAGPLECGVQALSHQGSLELGALTAAAAAAMAAEAAEALSYHDPHQQQHYHSAATSYQSALEVQEGELELALQQEEEEAAAAAAAAQQGEERQARAVAGQMLFEQQQQEQPYELEEPGGDALPAGEEPDAAVDDFAAKLNVSQRLLSLWCGRRRFRLCRPVDAPHVQQQRAACLASSLLPHEHGHAALPSLPLLQGLMQRMSSDMAQLHVGGCPPTPPEGLLAPGEGGSAAAAEDAAGVAHVRAFQQRCLVDKSALLGCNA
jgi:hypothetical protein